MTTSHDWCCVAELLQSLVSLYCYTRRSRRSDPVSEIIPPTIESCPSGPIVHVTTSQATNESGSEVKVEVAKPNVVFRLAGLTGQVTSHHCSHFANGRSDWFSIGRHVVTCSAFDPTFVEYDDGGSELQRTPPPMAQCQFIVDVQGNVRLFLVSIVSTKCSLLKQTHFPDDCLAPNRAVVTLSQSQYSDTTHGRVEAE